MIGLLSGGQRLKLDILINRWDAEPARTAAPEKVLAEIEQFTGHAGLVKKARALMAKEAEVVSRHEFMPDEDEEPEDEG